MHMIEKRYLDDWTLRRGETLLKASVPGDITMDHYRAGLVQNPYVRENYKDAEWIGHEDFTYETSFDVSREELSEGSNELVFDGIDLFSDVYLNGTHLGDTKNAFLQYRFQVNGILKEKGNVLRVKMHSTLEKASQINVDGYAATFNIPRIFLRKPQCHFGWDWAPKICAYGITGKVYLESKNTYHITDVHYKSDDKGNLNFFVEVNYTTQDVTDIDCNILEKGTPSDEDKIIVKLEDRPGSKVFQEYEVPYTGKKNFLSLTYDFPKLWWPRGYGKQPLYRYVVELYRGGKKIDEKEGRFAFRSVSVMEVGKPNGTIGFDFLINGKKIYLKGSNWVPPECFTGEMKDDKYRDLLLLAKNANLNILRVWGGGNYESGLFYDLCDEYGLMVWQDICLACGDIPEDDKEFVDNLIEEVTYQVKRLRNHPSLIYWCGGNEKTGSYGNLITHGDFLVNCILYGVIYDLDDTRPYRRQSPHSYTDIGNDWTSGDSHAGSFELALVKGMDNYRSLVASKTVPFVSECAVMGPSSVETLGKIFGPEHLWPMDEIWKDRLMDNPYSAIKMDFPHRELYYAESLYGKTNGIEDFVKKGMLIHAEALKCEAEYSRSQRANTGAFLNWMFDDIWPSATWAIIDYYLEPKEAYYALKRSFADTLASFYQGGSGITHFFFSNSSNKRYTGSVTYGMRKANGETLLQDNIFLEKQGDHPIDICLPKTHYEKNVYFFASFEKNGKTVKTFYSPSFWKDFPASHDFTYSFRKINRTRAEITVRANGFVKSLFIHFKDNFKYIYEDNYIDLEKGEERTISIKAKEPAGFDDLKLESF